MGIYEFFKNKLKEGDRVRPNQEISRFEMFSAFQPAFRTWGGEIFESRLVRQSIYAHARHAMKLKPEFQGTVGVRIWRGLENGPNEYQTWPEFLERCENIYQSQNNLFITPILDEFDQLIGYWALYPSGCEVRMHQGEAFLHYTFANGKKMAMELRRTAVIKKHQLKNDFFGENNDALNATMEMDAMTVQGIIEGIKNASGYQFMAELTNKQFDEDVKKQQEEFDELNFGKRGGRGLLLFNGNLKNVKQVEPGKMPVNAAQMKMTEENVMTYFGTNPEILMNTADSNKLNSFYDGEIEPFAIKLSDAMTRMTFTPAEIHRKNRIMFASNRLQYMSATEKVNISKELGDRGCIMIDEIRELFNYPPLPDGKGQRAPIRGEYGMVGEGKYGDDSGKGDSGKGGQDGKKDGSGKDGSGKDGSGKDGSGKDDSGKDGQDGKKDDSGKDNSGKGSRKDKKED